ncbi:MAG TPA: FKBP-type peptidyl-prolyl cis-trans isomerase [Steroidobacteraceae bacterium]|nr:FKBP-type peptidyl-prolyl cis-trans isomerase [Steroidobacteraceae bacterium]
MPRQRLSRGGALTGAALCTFLAAATAAETPTAPATPPAPPAAQPPAPDPTLLVTDVVKGIGDEALPGMVVIVHYTGWLYDPAAKDHRGRKFDSSRDRRQPFSFPLGSAHVIRGWEQGIPGMKVGGTRRLVIPPALAYGEKGAGNGVIPPNATLLFEVELLAVESVTRHEQQ